MHELLLGDLPFGTRETPDEEIIENTLFERLDFSSERYSSISSDGE